MTPSGIEGGQGRSDAEAAQSGLVVGVVILLGVVVAVAVWVAL